MRLSSPHGLHQSDGSAVIVLMALLSLMLLFVFANLKTLSYLSRELKLVERHQIERLQKSSATNVVVAVSLPQTKLSGVVGLPPPQGAENAGR